MLDSRPTCPLPQKGLDSARLAVRQACLAVRQVTIDVFVNSLNMNDMNW